MTDRGTFDVLAAPVLASMAAGASVADSAVHNGISARTVYRWLARGRANPSGPYGLFAAEVDRQRELRRLSTAGPMMGEDELRQCVWRAARAGSIPALRLAWKILQAERGRAL